jgi:uncharacterized membrane protein YkvA (DUF1232 family)
VGERKETPGGPRWKSRAEGLKADTYALYLAFRDPRTPWYAKLLAAGVVVYAVSPIDLIPDFIPVLGFLDDLVIVPLGAALAIRMVPREVMADCREKARSATGTGAPRRTRWLAAAIVVAIWCLIAALVVLAVRAN